MRINTNMAALNAWRTMTNNSGNLQKSLERLASGLRVNRAADDAAGLAVSEKMTAQIRGLGMATRNTQDAISMVQTAEGGASKLQEMMQRMRELAVQAGSDTLQNSDRDKLQDEFAALQQEITRTANTVTYNNRELINGASGNRAAVIAGNEITNVSVSSAATATGTYTIDVTQLAREQIHTTTAKDKDNAGVTFVGGSTLTALFGTAFVGGDQLRFTQNDKSLVIDLAAQTGNTTSTFVQHINDQAAAYGMDFTVAISGGNLVVESNVAGTYGNVQISQTITADPDMSFGFSVTQTSLDALATITNPAAATVAPSSYTFRGNEFTGTSGALNGFKFTAVATGGTASQVTFVNNSVTFQVGANAGEAIATSFGNLTAENLLVSESDVNIRDRSAANTALTAIDSALSNVSSERAKMGATQNRLENTIANLQTQQENLTAANSRIRDLDMASEMAQFTKFQILSQASTAMLAQANQITQGVLSLLR